jgi:uncharacterized protein (DUF736 family)
MALKRIGALWTKKNKKGEDFMSGTVEMGALGHINVMVFQNEKQEENHPDYTVHLVTEDEPEKK